MLDQVALLRQEIPTKGQEYVARRLVGRILGKQANGQESLSRVQKQKQDEEPVQNDATNLLVVGLFKLARRQPTLASLRVLRQDVFVQQDVVQDKVLEGQLDGRRLGRRRRWPTTESWRHKLLGLFGQNGGPKERLEAEAQPRRRVGKQESQNLLAPSQIGVELSILADLEFAEENLLLQDLSGPTHGLALVHLQGLGTSLCQSLVQDERSEGHTVFERVLMILGGL